MLHADLICVPQLMSGEQALAAQIGGYSRGREDLGWSHCVRLAHRPRRFPSDYARSNVGCLSDYPQLARFGGSPVCG